MGRKVFKGEPACKVGDRLVAGDVIGTVQERAIKHKIMVPFTYQGTGTIKSIVQEGDFWVQTIEIHDGVTWSDGAPVTVNDFISELVQSKNWNKLDDAFYKINSFGTAGVRGKLAIGTANFNRIILGLGVEAETRDTLKDSPSTARLQLKHSSSCSIGLFSVFAGNIYLRYNRAWQYHCYRFMAWIQFY